MYCERSLFKINGAIAIITVTIRLVILIIEAVQSIKDLGVEPMNKFRLVYRVLKTRIEGILPRNVYPYNIQLYEIVLHKNTQEKYTN